jgi:hypothetical protein
MAWICPAVEATRAHADSPALLIRRTNDNAARVKNFLNLIVSPALFTYPTVLSCDTFSFTVERPDFSINLSMFCATVSA